MPEAAAKLPIRRNKGIAAMSTLVSAETVSTPKRLTAASKSAINAKPKKPVSPIAAATGTPRTSATNMRQTVMAPAVAGSMSGLATPGRGEDVLGENHELSRRRERQQDRDGYPCRRHRKS